MKIYLDDGWITTKLINNLMFSLIPNISVFFVYKEENGVDTDYFGYLMDDDYPIDNEDPVFKLNLIYSACGSELE